MKGNSYRGFLGAQSSSILRLLDTFVDCYVESLVLLDKVANGTVTYWGNSVRCISCLSFFYGFSFYSLHIFGVDNTLDMNI